MFYRNGQSCCRLLAEQELHFHPPEDEWKMIVNILKNVLGSEEKARINEGVFEYLYETTVVTIHRK